MKRLTFVAIAAFTLLVTLAVTPASAQMSKRMSAEIPFAFEVEGARLDAGAYIITPLKGTAALLLIRRAGDGRGTLVLSIDARVARGTRSDAWLVFRKYGDQYFLGSAWVGQEGKEVLPSQRERRLRKELRRGGVAGTPGAAPAEVMIAAVAH